MPKTGRATGVDRIRAPDAATTLARSLYERYNQPVYRYCMSRLRSPEEAEDAMQSTFLRAFSAMQRGVEPDYEAAWLFKIAHNVCLSRSLASARRGRVEAPADLQAMQDEIGGPVRERDELIQLDDALAEMPERLRTAFLLREWQGLSYQEIADRLEISHSAVETLIFRARKHLAHALTEPAAKAAKRARAALESLGLSSVLKGLFGGAAAKTAAVAVGLAGITAAGVVGGTLVAAPDAPATASANPPGAAAAGSGSFGSLPTTALSPGLALLIGLPLEQVGWLPGPIGGVLGVQAGGTTAGDVALAAGVAAVAAAGGPATGSSPGGPFGSAFPLAQPPAPNGTTPTGALPLVGSSPAPPSATVPGTTFPSPVPGVTTPVPGVTTPVPGVTPPIPGVRPPGITTPTPTVPTPTTPSLTTPTVTKPSMTVPTVPTVSVTTPTVTRPTVTRPTVTTPTVTTPSITLPTVTTPTVTTPTVPRPTVTTPTVPTPTVTTPSVPIPTVTTPTVPIPTVPTPSVTTPTVPPPPLPKPPPPPPPPPIPTVPPPPVPIPTIPPPPPVPIPTIPTIPTIPPPPFP